MKKQWLLFFGVITAVVLALWACVRFALENGIEGYLPGIIDIESYTSDFGRDSVDYKKYTYKDTKRLRKKLENHKYFKPVTDDDVEYIISFFNNFERWVEGEDFASQYDFDKSYIDAGDYFYIEDVKTYGDDPDFEGLYRDFDVYYFDMQSMALYYVHIDI